MSGQNKTCQIYKYKGWPFLMFNELKYSIWKEKFKEYNFRNVLIFSIVIEIVNHSII